MPHISSNSQSKLNRKDTCLLMEYNSRQSITALPKELPANSSDKTKRRPRRERSVKPDIDTSGIQLN